MEQLGAIFSSLFVKGIEWKLVGSVALSVYSFFFHPAQAMLMLSIVALIIFDMVTGIMASKINKEQITSRRVFKTALKFGVYCTLISAAHLAEVSVFGELFLEEAMIAFLALTELISIIENAGKMGFAVPKKLLGKLQELRGEELTENYVHTKVKTEVQPDGNVKIKAQVDVGAQAAPQTSVVEGHSQG